MVTADNWEGLHQNLSGFKYLKATTHNFSLGAGYSSPGSFFADAAVRLTSYPVSYYGPYYYTDYDAVDSNGNALQVGSPLEKLNRRVVDLVLTFGWRF